MTRVAILGGGVAGLTAAHELAERGFEVVVLEARDIPGGKARSLPVPGSGTGGRKDLTGATRILLAQADGRNELVAGAHLPESLEDLTVLSRFLFEWMTSLGIPAHEHAV